MNYYLPVMILCLVPPKLAMIFAETCYFIFTFLYDTFLLLSPRSLTTHLVVCRIELRGFKISRRPAEFRRLLYVLPPATFRLVTGKFTKEQAKQGRLLFWHSRLLQIILKPLYYAVIYGIMQYLTWE